ncbi:MAG: HAMP domain-containing sensor histidine kinase [Bacteroidota bacterium]
MRLYEQKIWWKRVLFVIAIGIGIFSLWYTNQLVQKLAKEEEKKVLLWANATKQLVKAEGDFTFLLDIIKDNETIPVILVDDKGEIIAHRNLDSTKSEQKDYLQLQLGLMKEDHEPIPILYDEANKRYNYLYYKNSIILTQLKRYPYYQLTVIGIFIVVAYLAFSSSRRAEQNQVWVGMSKETAHQLGTPISSLMGWINLIRETEKEGQEELLLELEKDVKRLELITERFSKIGSAPKLDIEVVDDVLQDSINYLKVRTSERVQFTLVRNEDELTAQMNVPLFEWVIENICKNAIDAMNGEGSITMTTQAEGDSVIIDIIDTGKGIPQSKIKTVFKPGYTTKKRGWGLGLSLAKRIIEDYHRGKIFVKTSEVNKGTTFRIVLQA